MILFQMKMHLIELQFNVEPSMTSTMILTASTRPGLLTSGKEERAVNQFNATGCQLFQVQLSPGWP